MCARYELDSGVIDEAVFQCETHNPDVFRLALGNVRPSDPSLVIAGYRDHFHAGVMTWGIPRNDGKGLVINARSETAMTLPMFQSSMLHRRCLIPARAFYEWDSQKNKITFSLPEQKVIYLAGIYDVIDGRHRYTILTTEANASVARFHDRLPVILSQEAWKPWLFDSDAAEQLVKQDMPVLKHHQAYEQVSLF